MKKKCFSLTTPALGLNPNLSLPWVMGQKEAHKIFFKIRLVWALFQWKNTGLVEENMDGPFLCGMEPIISPFCSTKLIDHRSFNQVGDRHFPA